MFIQRSNNLRQNRRRHTPVQIVVNTLHKSCHGFLEHRQEDIRAIFSETMGKKAHITCLLIYFTPCLFMGRLEIFCHRLKETMQVSRESCRDWIRSSIGYSILLYTVASSIDYVIDEWHFDETAVLFKYLSPKVGFPRSNNQAVNCDGAVHVNCAAEQVPMASEG